jgi:hypothetical protein
MDAFNVALTREEIAVIQTALSEHLTLLFKEWERQKSLGEKGCGSCSVRASRRRAHIDEQGWRESP